MAKRLKVVDGVVPTRLVATQIVPIPMIDGATSLGMLDPNGIVYTYVGTGWLKLNMVEVFDDTKV